MFSSFLSFAKTGNPNCEAVPELKPSTADKVYTIVYDEKTEVKEDFDEELVRVVNDLTPPRRMGMTETVPKDDDDEEGGRAWLY